MPESEPRLPAGWRWADFDQVFEHVTSSARKLARRHYRESGRYPVIDQGRQPIGGYTDEQELVHPCPPPVILFGDHTSRVKFVEQPFVQGADGVKVLRPLVHPRYAYWALRAVPIPRTGYARHFKYLRAARWPLAPAHEQVRVAAYLDDVMARLQGVRRLLERVRSQLHALSQTTDVAALTGYMTADYRRSQPEAGPGAHEIRALESSEPSEPSTPAEFERLPELPSTWAWVPLGRLLTGIEAGRSVRTLGRPARADEFGILKVSALTRDGFDPSQNKALASPPSPEHLVQPGDLLLSRANTATLVGTAVLATQPPANLALSDKTLRLVPRAPLGRPEYLVHCLRAPWVRQYFERCAGGSSASMRNLARPHIRAAPIPVPPVSEQRVLVEALTRARESLGRLGGLCDQLEAQIEQLERTGIAHIFDGTQASGLAPPGAGITE